MNRDQSSDILAQHKKMPQKETAIDMSDPSSSQPRQKQQHISIQQMQFTDTVDRKGLSENCLTNDTIQKIASSQEIAFYILEVENGQKYLEKYLERYLGVQEDRNNLRDLKDLFGKISLILRQTKQMPKENSLYYYSSYSSMVSLQILPDCQKKEPQTNKRSLVKKCSQNQRKTGSQNSIQLEAVQHSRPAQQMKLYSNKKDEISQLKLSQKQSSINEQVPLPQPMETLKSKEFIIFDQSYQQIYGILECEKQQLKKAQQSLSILKAQNQQLKKALENYKQRISKIDREIQAKKKPLKEQINAKSHRQLCISCILIVKRFHEDFLVNFQKLFRQNFEGVINDKWDISLNFMYPPISQNSYRQMNNLNIDPSGASQSSKEFSFKDKKANSQRAQSFKSQRTHSLQNSSIKLDSQHSQRPNFQTENRLLPNFRHNYDTHFSKNSSSDSQGHLIIRTVQQSATSSNSSEFSAFNREIAQNYPPQI